MAKTYYFLIGLLFFSLNFYAQTVALNDVDTVDQDTTLTISAANGLLVNDFDVQGDPFTVIQFNVNGTNFLAGQTATIPEGTITINADGSWEFIPTLGYSGTVPDIFYTISDGVDSSTATLFLTVETNGDLLEIEFISSCNQGYTTDGDYKIRYAIRVRNTSIARDYNPNSLITNIDLVDDLQSVFGNGCVTLIEEFTASTSLPDDFVNNPYPQEFNTGSLNTDFENITSNNILNTNAITNNTLYPRQYFNVYFCVTVNPFCNGRPNPTPSGSGITFDNLATATSSRGNPSFLYDNLQDFHTTETTVAANLFIPVVSPIVQPDGRYNFTNTVIITNDGTATANNVNYNMGLSDFLDNGITFDAITLTQTSGSAITLNPLYNGNTESLLLTNGNSLNAGETIIIEINYLTIQMPSTTITSRFRPFGVSMTQGTADSLDGFDEFLPGNKRIFSYAIWSDALGNHLDRYYIAANGTDIPSSNDQCQCSSLRMEFGYTFTVTTSKIGTVINTSPNGILEHEEIQFNLTIQNDNTNLQLTNLQIQEDLLSICGGQIFSVSTPIILSSTATIDPILNAGFNGTTNTNIFDGTSGLLDQKPTSTSTPQQIVIQFTVIFEDDCIGNNIVNASATDISNFATVTNASNTVGINVFTDTDNDGISNVNDIDDDNDGIPDTVEYNGVDPLGDADADNIPNYRDGIDTNFDGIADAFDFDLDGVPNHFDLDSDNDGITDALESGNSLIDTNNNGSTNNPVGANGLDNTLEDVDTNFAIINYVIPNSDTDTPLNYLDIDSDNDGIVDNIEAQASASYIAPSATANGMVYTNGLIPVDTDADTIPDYLDANSDNDVRLDIVEAWDTDSNGIAETLISNIDSDNDGLDNAFDVDDTQINPTNGQTPQSFPNAENTATPELDWRELLGIQVVVTNETDVEGNILTFTFSLQSRNGIDITTANAALFGSSTDITIDVVTADGIIPYQDAVVPYDYTEISNTPITTLTILAGQFNSTISVTTLDDNIYENDELFNLTGTITSNNTINGQVAGVGTIQDDELPPTITITDSTEDEGTALAHIVTLSHPSSTPIIFEITTADNSAISPDDYLGLIDLEFTINGTVDPANANTQTTVNITTINDGIDESDAETLLVQGIVTTTNTSNTNLTAIGTILDVEPDPTVTLDSPIVIEGDTLVFTLTLSNISDEDIGFNIFTNDGSADSPADFTAISTTTLIPALSDKVTVQVTTFDDIINEDTETMLLNAVVNTYNTANTNVDNIGTIKDNDVPNLFSPNNDGLSDTFAIAGLEAFPNFTLQIFDRWGSEVYNYQNKGNPIPFWWNGTYKDKPVPTGVYYYILDYNDGVSKPKTSFVELIR